MSDRSPEFPEIDFATDEIPNLHQVLEVLREQGAVVPVVYRGGSAYMITRFKEVNAAYGPQSSLENPRVPL